MRFDVSNKFQKFLLKVYVKAMSLLGKTFRMDGSDELYDYSEFDYGAAMFFINGFHVVSISHGVVDFD